MDAYQERILNIIRDANFLFDAVQTAGNEAMRQVGHNCSYELIPGIMVRYELLDHGPEHVYYRSQYNSDPDEYGEPIDQSRLNYNSYLRIIIEENGVVVCCIEGPGAFHMSYHADGPWEDKLLDWFRADGGVLR